MRIKALVCILFLYFTVMLAAQNHMDIMTTMTGEHNFAEIGLIMTTLDWNGDGYDDLVAMENGWRPNQFMEVLRVNAYGKILVFFGGPNFDNIPELSINGSYQQEFWATFSICNAGDMNGDGIDDLALFRATMFENHNEQNYDLQLCIYYGGATPDTIPGYVLTFPREEWDNEFSFVRGLGDINNDGFDDLGYQVERVGTQYIYMCNIIMGGNMENIAFREISNSQAARSMCGLGDVNADGIDDFYLGTAYTSNNTQFHRIILYFGNSNGVYSDSLIIVDEPGLTCSFAYPASDTNWDGFPDFVSCFSSSTSRLYYGGPGLSETNFVTITPSYHGGEPGAGFGYGDVNGNGTSDFMGTYFSQTGAGYGDAFLWLGGVPMNGGADLNIAPPDYAATSEMFGFCLTTGDYNGDGYCDAAISAPFDYAGWPVPGRVFVYAGNAQLNDPTPISDNTQTPEISRLQLYPNPLQPQQEDLKVRYLFAPPAPISKGRVTTFEVFNIKGQKEMSFVLSAEQSRSGTAVFNLGNLATGVYLCTLSCGEQKLTGKITIIR